MNTTQLNKISTEALVNFWNEHIGREFPMTEELFEQNTMRNEFVCHENSGIVKGKNGEVKALIVVKKNTETNYQELKKKIGWIQVIIVNKKNRGKGIGTKLLKNVERKLKKEGIEKLFIGKDPYHYFPGVPVKYQETQEWLEENNYEKDGMEYDLINKYVSNIGKPIEHETVEFSLLDYSEKNDLKKFMKKEFPGRWEFELNEYFKNGGDGREFVIGKENDEIIGFCRINDSNSPLIAQNIYWSPLFEEELGGMGPLGISSSKRGMGYGLLIVEAGIYFLRKRDISRVVIDWTTLVDFYEKLGFKVWKSYETYSKEL